MRIHFVAPTYEKWILHRLARSFHKNIPDSSISDHADLDADVNVYFNYALFNARTNCDVGFFTHMEHNTESARRFNEVAGSVDWCIAMCDKTAALLPQEKTSVIHVAPDPQFHKKKIILGVVGREYETGRKRTNWHAELAKIPDIKIRYTNGRVPWRLMPWFYRSIDYLLILSDNEGGPVPLLEALAMGVPVISSDVGFVSDYTTIRFHDLEDLKRVIRGLVIRKDAWFVASAKLEAACRKALESKAASPKNNQTVAPILKNQNPDRLHNKVSGLIPERMKSVLYKLLKPLLRLVRRQRATSKKRPPFYFKSRPYRYFVHSYNNTWLNERTVEIPIFQHLVAEYAGKDILEIGNVLKHYSPIYHDVVDKYEKGVDVINCDILEFESPNDKKYDLIVSISNFEHIGFDEQLRCSNGDSEYKNDDGLIRAIKKTKSLLKRNGMFVLSTPLGANANLDKLIESQALGMAETVFLKRCSNENDWIEVDYSEVRGIHYDSPFPNANAVMIGFYRNPPA